MLRKRMLMRRARLSDEGQLEHQGIQRRYLLYTPPSYRAGEPMPLVVGLHGGYTNGSRFAVTTGFNDLADEQGFLVVYPEGCDRHWNDGREGVNPNIDDVGFIETLLDELHRLRSIDPKRIYAAGISNGGYLVQRLAAELPHRIAAFATVAAALPVNVRASFASQTPVSVLMINGKQDEFVPWQGGQGRRGKGGRILSIPETFEFWRDRSNCQQPASTTDLGDARHPEIEVTRYLNSATDTEVMLIALSRGGHTWPGGYRQPKFLVGETNRSLNASRLIWTFFQRHMLAARDASRTGSTDRRRG